MLKIKMIILFILGVDSVNRVANRKRENLPTQSCQGFEKCLMCN